MGNAAVTTVNITGSPGAKVTTIPTSTNTTKLSGDLNPCLIEFAKMDGDQNLLAAVYDYIELSACASQEGIDLRFGTYLEEVVFEHCQASNPTDEDILTVLTKTDWIERLTDDEPDYEGVGEDLNFVLHYGWAQFFSLNKFKTFFGKVSSTQQFRDFVNKATTKITTMLRTTKGGNPIVNMAITALQKYGPALKDYLMKTYCPDVTPDPKDAATEVSNPVDATATVLNMNNPTTTPLLGGMHGLTPDPPSLASSSANNGNSRVKSNDNKLMIAGERRNYLAMDTGLINLLEQLKAILIGGDQVPLKKDGNKFACPIAALAVNQSMVPFSTAVEVLQSALPGNYLADKHTACARSIMDMSTSSSSSIKLSITDGQIEQAKKNLTPDELDTCVDAVAVAGAMNGNFVQDGDEQPLPPVNLMQILADNTNVNVEASLTSGEYNANLDKHNTLFPAYKPILEAMIANPDQIPPSVFDVATFGVCSGYDVLDFEANYCAEGINGVSSMFAGGTSAVNIVSGSNVRNPAWGTMLDIANNDAILKMGICMPGTFVPSVEWLDFDLIFNIEFSFTSQWSSKQFDIYPGVAAHALADGPTGKVIFIRAQRKGTSCMYSLVLNSTQLCLDGVIFNAPGMFCPCVGVYSQTPGDFDGLGDMGLNLSIISLECHWSRRFTDAKLGYYISGNVMTTEPLVEFVNTITILSGDSSHPNSVSEIWRAATRRYAENMPTIIIILVKPEYKAARKMIALKLYDLALPVHKQYFLDDNNFCSFMNRVFCSLGKLLYFSDTNPFSLFPQSNVGAATWMCMTAIHALNAIVPFEHSTLSVLNSARNNVGKYVTSSKPAVETALSKKKGNLTRMIVTGNKRGLLLH